MTFEELKRQIIALDEEQFKALLDYMANLRHERWIKSFDEALAELRDGLTETELDIMIKAMNEEYIEPIDESDWQ
jgi:hypothetical protein